MGAFSIWHLLFLAILFAVYFLPSVIAFSRKHHNRAAILGLNFLLGWTVLGWIGSFVWALTAVVEAA